MGLKLRHLTRAANDLKDVRAYLIDNASPAVANRVRDDLRERINRLLHRPQIGKIVAGTDVRVLSASRYPYRIYFRADAEYITILHIRHSARRTPDIDELG